MKSHSCGWRTRSRSLGRRSFGNFGPKWLRGKARLKGESTSGVSSYMDHVAGAASFEAYRRHEVNPLLSAETLPESSSLIDFKSFAQEFPETLAPLVAQLRPEFQEYFVEYYLLEKSQSFIGEVHGQIQTRVWQNLRIIEQSIGALILLGTNPDAKVLRPILEKAGVETTPYGSLTFMILKYAENQNYAEVAKRVGAPVPAIRKIFRPIIAALLADKNVKAVAVGAYLRSLTHQASLTRAGLGKRCRARLRRVKTRHFTSPLADDSPLLSFGAVASLRNTPWCMLEISSDHRMTQIYPTLRAQAKRLFGKQPSQIFAPVNAEGELAFGYIFARSARMSLVRALTRVRGISELSSYCKDDGTFDHAITIPHADVEKMMDSHSPSKKLSVRAGDFVEILTGDAAHYCGTVTNIKEDGLTVEVKFPTGRLFVVTAHPTCVKRLPNISADKRKFWGVRL